MTTSVNGQHPEVVLKLYLTSPPEPDAPYIERIRQWCASHSLPLKLTVISVTEQPEEAEANRVFATPTLVRESPAPSRRVIGDLTDTETVMRLLQLT